MIHIWNIYWFVFNKNISNIWKVWDSEIDFNCFYRPIYYLITITIGLNLSLVIHKMTVNATRHLSRKSCQDFVFLFSDKRLIYLTFILNFPSKVALKVIKIIFNYLVTIINTLNKIFIFVFIFINEFPEKINLKWQEKTLIIKKM